MTIITHHSLMHVSLIHSLTPTEKTPILTLNQSLTNSLTGSLTHAFTHPHTIHTHTHSLTHYLTHSAKHTTETLLNRWKVRVSVQSE